MIKRISYLDFLKFIGLSGIIIAHVNSPDIIMMIRNFDVPLMVILSSLLANRSYDKYVSSDLSVLRYIVARVKRLVIPTWLFLCFYFIFDYIYIGNSWGFRYYVDSFLFTRYGIKYVWIILIYLYSAIFIPLFYCLKKSNKLLVLFACIYILYELAYCFKFGTSNKFLDTTVFYIIPYGLLTYFGYNYLNMGKKSRLIIFLISFVMFISMGAYNLIVSGRFISVQEAKYPPRIYYLSYGVAWSFGLLLLCEKFNCKFFESSIIKFVSSHSLWIYLWHIFVLTCYGLFGLPDIWYLKFVIVYTVSVLIVLIVNKLLDIIEKKHKFLFFKYLRG